MSSNAGSDESLHRVDDNEILLRLVWDPDDIDSVTGELMTSAFSRDDLKSTDRGLSLNRKSLANRDVMLCIANRQQANAKPGCREDLYLSEILTSSVRSIQIDKINGRVLDVASTPIAAENDCPANDAHAEIFNISGEKGKSVTHEIRIKLQEIFSKPVSFDKLMP